VLAAKRSQVHALMIQKIQNGFCIILHFGSQQLDVLFEFFSDCGELGDTQILQPQKFGAVVFVEDEFSGVEYFVRYVPTFVAVGFLHGVIDEQSGERRVVAGAGDECVDGFSEQIFGVERNLKSGGQIQIVRNSADDTVREFVDG